MSKIHNILIVADLYYPQINGCAYFAQRLAKSLSIKGHNILVIAPSESLAYTLNTINGIKVFGVRSYPILFYPGFRFCLAPAYNKRIAKIVLNFAPDIIHCQFHLGVNRAVLKIAKFHDIPIIATNHFMPETMVHYVPFASIIGDWLLKMAWQDFAKVYNKMDLITTPTTTASHLIARYFPDPVVPVSCGIDLELFKPGQNAQYLRERYRLKALPTLLYVGRLDKEKHVDFVINATAIAMRTLDLQLVIAGQGTQKDKLQQLVIDLQIADLVRFTGFVPDVDLPYLYCLADCFIIAGTAELQSIVTMEAMATALPILAVNAVALPELVLDGENGYLFELNDPHILAAKIKIILADSNLKHRMSQKSYALIAEHSMSKILCQYESIYRTHAKQCHNI